MAKMCPLNGCKSCQGLCIHDKLMMASGVLVVLAVLVRYVFVVF
jgi:hypothetical protein